MTEIVGKARDALILSILKRIEEDTQVIGAPQRAEAWERGWRENLDAFKASPCMESLVPKFIRPGQPVRCRQAFHQPEEPYHELRYVRQVLQTFILPRMRDCHRIYEFGCGTGYNLFVLAEAIEHTTFCGADFSMAAVELVRLAAEKLEHPVLCGKFDMLAPPEGGPGVQDSGVFTFGAIEQLASRFEPFIEYLIAQRPRIVCHVEPIVEFMDETNLVDWLGAKFHRKRGYSEGFLPYLQNHPKIEVLSAERSWFGSVMMESYGRIAWRVRS